MGSGVGARGSDVTALPRAPRSASPAGTQVCGQARGQVAGSRGEWVRGRLSGGRQGEPGGEEGAGVGAAAGSMRCGVLRCGLRAGAGPREARRALRAGALRRGLGGRS